MELLSPAGHWESMVAAVQNGADAVYLGLDSLNARQGAKNFSPEEFPAAVDYCHLRGAKLYLTLNTLLTDRELDRGAELLRLASRSSCDGVIVQDWGLAALARRIVPDLPLHGSTQMTVHSLAGVEAAARLGLSCVVLGRELSREDIRTICEKSPIKIEVFAHGALCMCWSGQCAMSALIGGNSGNRGRCKQPCRLPYRLDGGKMGRPLSLKDASLAGHLAELQDMGVDILKLEGRMKRPEYVAVVTRIYAALLRERRRPTAEELGELELAFSRGGFTQGYWDGALGPAMFGSRPENAPVPTELFQAAKAAYDQEDLRTVPVTLRAHLAPDRPASLTAADRDGHAVTVTGPCPEAAHTRALTAEEVSRRLGRTGGTVFRAECIDCQVAEGLSLPASALNGLRREALDRLARLRCAPPKRREEPVPSMPENGFAGGEPVLTVSLSRGDQLTEALLALSPAVVYLPAERISEFDAELCRHTGGELCVSLPRICKDREEPALRAMLEKAKARGCVSAAVQNVGQLALARELGFSLRGDFGLNVFNSRSLEQLRDWGLESACLSFELRHEQIRDLRKPLPCETLVYGRLPLMVVENCLVRNGLGCTSRDLYGPCVGGHSLTDRRGEVFPILPVFGCRSELENSRRLYLADKPDYRRCGLACARLRFTDEGPEDCVRVLRQYLAGGEPPAPEDTRGLFYRGVE